MDINEMNLRATLQDEFCSEYINCDKCDQMNLGIPCMIEKVIKEILTHYISRDRMKEIIENCQTEWVVVGIEEKSEVYVITSKAELLSKIDNDKTEGK